MTQNRWAARTLTTPTQSRITPPPSRLPPPQRRDAWEEAERGEGAQDQVDQGTGTSHNTPVARAHEGMDFCPTKPLAKRAMMMVMATTMMMMTMMTRAQT